MKKHRKSILLLVPAVSVRLVFALGLAKPLAVNPLYLDAVLFFLLGLFFLLPGVRLAEKEMHGFGSIIGVTALATLSSFYAGVGQNYIFFLCVLVVLGVVRRCMGPLTVEDCLMMLVLTLAPSGFDNLLTLYLIFFGWTYAHDAPAEKVAGAGPWAVTLLCAVAFAPLVFKGFPLFHNIVSRPGSNMLPLALFLLPYVIRHYLHGCPTLLRKARSVPWAYSCVISLFAIFVPTEIANAPFAVGYVAGLLALLSIFVFYYREKGGFPGLTLGFSITLVLVAFVGVMTPSSSANPKHADTLNMLTDQWPRFLHR